jgi:hypothetical protein
MRNLTYQKTKPTLNTSSFDDALMGRSPNNKETCLLLDTSASMYGSPIQELRKVVKQFPDITRVCFNSRVQIIPPGGYIPDPSGGTDLASGIHSVKVEGFTSAVLITDGEPNSQPAAISAAKQTQIHLDIVFVGSGTEPPFLQELARACGGTCQSGSLEFTAQLVNTVTALLGAASEPTKGPIIL